MNEVTAPAKFGFIRWILFALASAYIVFLLFQSVYFNYQSSQKINNLKSELNKAQKDKEKIESLIAYYKTDSFQELEARKKLGFKLPDEKVVTVEIEKDETQIRDQIQESKKPEKPNYQLWMDFLSGKRETVEKL